MSRIPEAFVEEVVSRSDIVEVIGARVPLKKKGKEFAACCPFHQEKTPSFYVTPDKQFYHCFGCGAHGNVVGFLMEFDHLDFPTAIEHLAGRLGLEIPREKGDQEKLDRIGRLRQVTAMASDWFRGNLKQSSEAIEFLKQRGLTGETAARFALGFAPAGNHLEAALRQRARPDELVATGLLIQRDNGDRYDRFRGRVIFPIRDPRGHVIGFGGRVIGAGEPKYLNSPETELFHKGYGVYGLYESRQVDQRPDQLIVVEGYMDVVALAQFGIRNAVATLGTSTSDEHLGRLFRMVGEVVFCFDGDRAGRQAAARALETVLPQMIDGRQARFMFLPEGEDPDTLVRREGAEAFEDRITCASPLSEFLFDHAAEGRDLGSIEARERFASQVLSAIGKLPEGVLKSLLLAELSRRTGVDQTHFEALLSREVAEASPPDMSPASAEPMPPSSGERPSEAGRGQASLGRMARALQLLVHEPGLVERLPEDDDWCDQADPEAGLCREVVRLLRAGGYRSAQVLLAHFHGTPEGERLAALARQEPLVPRGLRGAELDNWVAYFQRHRRQQSPQEEYDALLARMQAGERLSQEQRQRLGELLTELKG